MIEENEVISLLYGLLEGLKAYREAYNKLNVKDGKLSNVEEKSFETKLEEVVKKYKQFEQLLYFLGKVIG